MNEKHPNRKKDKHNPYTLMIVEGRYYLSFKDGRGIMQNIEIDKVLYDLFNRFELEDISYLNRVSRHIEHSEFPWTGEVQTVIWITKCINTFLLQNLLICFREQTEIFCYSLH
ncbi:hypothetical protein [Dorea longicatena]|uniref:hypothetical protein n=1 Tax=Dorea longicatena TaxID=88431 RepID=UPI0034A1A0DB